MLFVPVAGVPVNESVVPFTVYADVGSCLTLSTKTSIEFASGALCDIVNEVVELFPLKESLEGDAKLERGDAPKYAILCYLHKTQTGICTVCCIRLYFYTMSCL